MYKKAATNYVVIVKNYQQTRGNNLTFFVEKPRNYQQNGKFTILRGKLMNPAVARVRAFPQKYLTILRGNPKSQ